MKKIFLFITLCFYSLSGAVINEKAPDNGISLAELSKTKSNIKKYTFIFESANASFTFNELPNDIKRFCISPHLEERIFI